MSWQTYVDEHLMCETEGHYLTGAAIIGHDGSVWAKSEKHLAPTGLFLGGTKYMVIQGEPGAVIRGKKTTQALIVGVYDEPMTPGQCNMVVERLGDYLIEQGL
ncbi:hypothetical protein MKW92_017601 [Papaver armeniacum]|nr:hypothetical protein MKW92_017601 [Papaver armeniacum]